MNRHDSSSISISQDHSVLNNFGPRATSWNLMLHYIAVGFLIELSLTATSADSDGSFLENKRGQILYSVSKDIKTIKIMVEPIWIFFYFDFHFLSLLVWNKNNKSQNKKKKEKNG